ncbi:MAG: hypothetical protein F4X97_12770 [Boseongicola sp. SB0662_bin_57]|nr:hypothetical protein [Boseongicola sp. SB0662_bin_57]
MRKLDCKVEWPRKRLTKVDRWLASSKTCWGNGTKAPGAAAFGSAPDMPGLRGRKHDRDTNAVTFRRQGILALMAEGLSVSACIGLRKMGKSPTSA